MRSGYPPSNTRHTPSRQTTPPSRSHPRSQQPSNGYPKSNGYPNQNSSSLMDYFAQNPPLEEEVDVDAALQDQELNDAVDSSHLSRAVDDYPVRIHVLKVSNMYPLIFDPLITTIQFSMLYYTIDLKLLRRRWEFFFPSLY